jgi:hypothetical protein
MWYCNWETEEGVRLVLASKEDSNGRAAHRRTKKVARGGAPVARTWARPQRGEEAAAASREALRAAHRCTKKAAPRLGSLTAQNQRDSAIRVSCRRGYSLYTRYIFGIG